MRLDGGFGGPELLNFLEDEAKVEYIRKQGLKAPRPAPGGPGATAACTKSATRVDQLPHLVLAVRDHRWVMEWLGIGASYMWGTNLSGWAIGTDIQFHS